MKGKSSAIHSRCVSLSSTKRAGRLPRGEARVAKCPESYNKPNADPMLGRRSAGRLRNRTRALYLAIYQRRAGE